MVATLHICLRIILTLGVCPTFWAWLYSLDQSLHTGADSSFAIIAPLTHLEGSPLEGVGKGLREHSGSLEATSFTFLSLFRVLVNV